MEKYSWNKINGVVVFNRNNPNFKISNTDEEILKLFRNHPVPILEKDTQNIIGFVRDVEFFTNDGLLIGDIMIWDMKKYNRFVFYNYEVVIKDNKITEICCIEFRSELEIA
jgi:hypothetical protein